MVDDRKVAPWQGILLPFCYNLASGEALAALSRKLPGSANFVDPRKSYNWGSFGMQIYTIDENV